jgi:hypothetical protein
LGILFYFFCNKIILLGFFPTDCPIGAGESRNSGRFATKDGRNLGYTQGSGREVCRACGKGQTNRRTPHPAQGINKVFELNEINSALFGGTSK